MYVKDVLTTHNAKPHMIVRICEVQSLFTPFSVIDTAPISCDQDFLDIQNRDSYTPVKASSYQNQKNEVPARICLIISAYRPIMYARRIQSPVLIMYAKNDSLIPAKAVEKMGSRIPNAEVIGLPAGHFDVYTGELFKQVVEKQAEFLAVHLMREMR